MQREAAARLIADLDAALAFVIERMTQQAELEEEPLDIDERYLLTHLPTQPTNPTIPSGVTDEYGPPVPMLRDFPFEKLCGLAKRAHCTDIRNRPNAARQWSFAASVLSLNRHPMSWLMGWAGIKTKMTVPWDGLLLVLSALIVVVVGLVGGIGLPLFTERYSALWKWALWGAGGLIYADLMILLYFGVKRLEKWQAEQTVERYRCDLPVRNSKS